MLMICAFQVGQWAHRIAFGSVNGILEYYYCPPGYCQCSGVDGSSNICNNMYHYDDDDRQCICDRKGVLSYSYNQRMSM